ncbi:MAG: D-erythronate dehydrogenase [Bacteroidota bacterium]
MPTRQHVYYMRILILGAAGFLGKKLVVKLLKKGAISLNGAPPKKIEELILFDRFLPKGIEEDPRVSLVAGDICDPSAIRSLLDQPVELIFHLAAVVSGEAEKNFDLGMKVNLHATLELLEVCRNLEQKPVLVFSSSCAAYGGELAKGVIKDETAATPMSSYGMQKVVGELLVNDYSRRGFIDGRILRLPSIVVRGGKANAATTSFISGIIREPLQGDRASCPVDRSTRVWILSPRRMTENFIHAAQLSMEKLGNNRILTMPGLSTTVDDMVRSLAELAGKEVADLIDWEPDEFIQSVVLTFPTDFETKRADELGFVRDESMREIIEIFQEDEMG